MAESGRRVSGESSYAEECRLVGLFIDTAKSYVQLSAGALVLTITFVREVLATPKEQKMHPDGLLIASWAAFLFAVIAGAAYQYVAIKYMESLSSLRSNQVPWGLKWSARSPGRVYGAMLVAFYAGAVLFTATAVRSLLR